MDAFASGYVAVDRVRPLYSLLPISISAPRKQLRASKTRLDQAKLTARINVLSKDYGALGSCCTFQATLIDVLHSYFGYAVLTQLERHAHRRAINADAEVRHEVR